VVNRIAARWAATVATTFEGTAARLPSVRVERTGNPIRREIATVLSHRDRLRTEACEAFGLERDRTTVFVFGGSQGAAHLDRVVADALPALASRGDLQLLVSAGPGNDGDLARRSIAGRVAGFVVPFIDRMDRAFALADVVVARAARASPRSPRAGCRRSWCRTPTPPRTTRRPTPGSWSPPAPPAWCSTVRCRHLRWCLPSWTSWRIERRWTDGPSRARGRGRTRPSASRRSASSGAARVTEADALWSPPPGSIPTLPVPRWRIGRAHLIGSAGGDAQPGAAVARARSRSRAWT
jgi:hypothetical protein